MRLAAWSLAVVVGMVGAGCRSPSSISTATFVGDPVPAAVEGGSANGPITCRETSITERGRAERRTVLVQMESELKGQGALAALPDHEPLSVPGFVMQPGQQPVLVRVRSGGWEVSGLMLYSGGGQTPVYPFPRRDEGGSHLSIAPGLTSCTVVLPPPGGFR